MTARRFDAMVIGGGLVGSAIAWGLRREGLSVALLDEGDAAYRASRGNFGLIWVQSKGLGAPWYQRWTSKPANPLAFPSRAGCIYAFPIVK
jgi:glycine/D-amino acid oxidase-like deaminating enzyme